MLTENEIKPKSQRYIRKSFLELLKTKGLYALTVLDIISRADISRSTFYMYYDDKYDLLDEIETELIVGFLKIMYKVRSAGWRSFAEGLKNDNYKIYSEYFTYIGTHAYAFNILFQDESKTNFSSRFLHAIKVTREETISIWLEQSPQLPLVFDEYRESMLSSIYLSLFSTWLKRGMDHSEEMMGRMLTRLWRSGLFEEL